MPVVLPDRQHTIGVACNWRGYILYNGCVVCGTETNNHCKEHNNYVCETCQEDNNAILNTFLDAQADAENDRIKANMSRPKITKS